MQRWHRQLHNALQSLWYSPDSFGLSLLPRMLLAPFSLVWTLCTCARRKAYQWGLLRRVRLSVPLIVVGNLTVGGTGKTPTVIALCEFLKRQGYRPGIIARGVGVTQAYGEVLFIDPQAMPTPSNGVLQLPDEAQLIAEKTNCPVALSRKRVACADYLLAHTDCDIIISDDGLQHYALVPDISIAIVDASRGLGNGWLLPAGPCRESIHRLATVDFILYKVPALAERINACSVLSRFAHVPSYPLAYTLREAYSISNPSQTKPLSAFAGEAEPRLLAIAGIGNPRHFFDGLLAAGVACQTLAFPDHYAYSMDDFSGVRAEQTVLMTEKDAVKVRAFAPSHHWAVRAEVNIPSPFFDAVLRLCRHSSNKGDNHDRT